MYAAQSAAEPRSWRATVQRPPEPEPTQRAWQSGVRMPHS
jgi:hypothetical protein